MNLFYILQYTISNLQFRNLSHLLLQKTGNAGRTVTGRFFCGSMFMSKASLPKALPEYSILGHSVSLYIFANTIKTWIRKSLFRRYKTDLVQFRIRRIQS